MKIVCLLLAFFIAQTVTAQNQQQPVPVIYLKDKNGIDLLGKSSSVEQKDYLLYKDYTKGVLVTNNDQKIEGFKYKLDLKSNILYYTVENDQEMEVVTPVKRVELELANGKKRIFQKGYSGSGDLKKETFAEVLVDGKASLLVLHSFIEVEKIEYGGGLKKFTDKLFYYYGVVGSKTMLIQKTDDLLMLFQDRSKETTEYIAAEKIKAKKQADLEKLFTWYNSQF